MTFIRQQLPLYDSQNPHFGVSRTYPDGSFYELGGIRLTRWDYRLTNFVISEYPRILVALAGRNPELPARNATVLTIRVGALRARHIQLSTDWTTLVHITSAGVVALRYFTDPKGLLNERKTEWHKKTA